MKRYISCLLVAVILVSATACGAEKDVVNTSEKKEIVEELTSRLDQNEELEIEFNRDQFRKYAEDKMQSMQEFQNK